MFWGLIMEPNKRYSQLVERSFHLSMASLDVTSANDQPVQVMLCYENRNYLLCTLKKGSHYQVPLDLNFQEGTKIAFTCNGFGHVHLTGYLTLDEDFDLGDLEEEEDEDEEEEEIPQLVKNKRKAVEPIKNDIKKAKKEIDDDNESSDDDDDDDDDEDMEAESDSDNDDSKLMGEDEVDSDESDDDDEEDDDDSDDESEQEVEKPKQKQKQKQNENQNQVGKKQDKQKMVNGKDAKPDGKQKKNKSEQQQQQQNSQQQQQQQPKRRTIEGGVQVEDLKVGNGAPAKPGRSVAVYYVGRLKSGKKFDETKQGEGFKFKLGSGDVIKGWDVGISGMKVGGKRRLTIPAAMGYGQKGSPPVIPGNSTLIFEVELKNVH